MEIAQTIFYFCVILISLIVFAMKVTGPNTFITFIAIAFCRLVPLFCILYAGVQIFKHFGII